MKKHFTFLAAFSVIAMGISGKTLTPEEALARLNSSRQLTPAVTMKNAGSFDLAYTAADESGEPAVYLFSGKADGGYLVLPADDLAAPVLGYSESVVTDVSSTGMPPQMRWWLDEYSRQIQVMRDNPDKPYAPAPRAATTTERTPISPLCSTKWGQGAPFNQFCPVVDGQTSITGCGATALAQVLKYHRWPAKGEGTGVCSDVNGNYYTMDLGEVTFDWENMPDFYTESSSSQENEAVALLMKACGYAIGMEYSPNWSNSSTTNIAAALRNNFGYAKSVKACQLSHYGMEIWEQMLYDNLAKIGPVIYRGNSLTDGGHIFVCDGYATDGYFHFNWGWNGAYDGYFRLSAMNPYVSYSGMENGGFAQGQWAILGICKPSETSEPVSLDMTQDGNIYCSVSGSMATLQCGWWNFSGDVMSVEMGIKVENIDRESNFTPVYVDGVAVSRALQVNHGWNNLSVDLGTLNLPDGMYKLTPLWRDAVAESEWKLPLHPVNFADYAVVEKMADAYEAYDVAPAMLKISAIEIPSVIYNRRNLGIKMTISNDTQYPIASYIQPIMTYDWNIIGRSNGFMVALNPGESVETTCVAGFSWNAQEGDGIYRIHLMDYDSWDVLAAQEIQVGNDPGAPVLSCNSFTLSGGTHNVNPDDMVFTAEVECTKGYHALPLALHIFRPKDGTLYSMMSASSVPVFLSAADKATVDFKFSLDEASRSEPELYAILFYMGANGYNELARIPFTIDQSGVESIPTDGHYEIAMRYDSATGTLAVEALGGIKDVTVLSIDGKQIARHEINGDATALLPMSELAKGIYVAVAHDCLGNRNILKIRN